MDQWLEESKNILKQAEPGFNLIVDMRELKPLPKESQETMNYGQMLYMQKGMNKASVLVANATTAMQFKRLGKEVGILDRVKYISVGDDPDWEKTAFAWIDQIDRT